MRQTRVNGNIIVIALIVLFILLAFIGVKTLNNVESNKFLGTWSNGSQTWVFEENGLLKCSTDTQIQEGSYKVEKGHLFVVMGDVSSTSTTEYIYYFSSDNKILELHWLIGDGFMTLTKIA